MINGLLLVFHVQPVLFLLAEQGQMIYDHFSMLPIECCVVASAQRFRLTPVQAAVGDVCS